jgi:UDP-N-acetylglucosamine:LPS N-acetylglucosamine transferase
MKTIDLVYFNFGGGHRSAALALQEVIREQKRPWQVRLINLVEVLDPKNSFRKFTGIAPEAIYNKRLERGWTYGLATELKLLHGMIRFSHASVVSRLLEHWSLTRPDLVVSLVPNFNKALCESVAGALGDVPFVTVMTDMADYPPNFWIEAGQSQHLVCGTQHAATQARLAGYDAEKVHLTSGMILRPAFYRELMFNREAECRKLGLDPQQRVGIVLFGGHGSTQMLSIAKALADVQLILLCGHNSTLQAQLEALETQARHVVMGFTSEIELYMRLGDFLIGKPGPGSLSEAVQLGLPVITFNNRSTMPQERYNASWVRETGVGLVLHSQRALHSAVMRMIQNLPEFRSVVDRIDNRAVFEVADIFQQLLNPAAPHWDADCLVGASASPTA